MLFDRYRKKPNTPNDKKKSSLANSFLKRFPISLTSSKKLKKQDENVNVINQPRPSVSLPNITTIEIHADSPIIAPKAPLQSDHSSPHITPSAPHKEIASEARQRKRHSAEQRKRRHHLVSMQDVHRHSFTFGHFPSNKSNKLTMAELCLTAAQLAKLDKLVGLQDNTEALLAQLGTTQPPLLVPHRSISHQHLQIPLQQPHQKLNRTHSESHAKTMEREADPIEPDELIELLTAEQQNQGPLVTLIDVRNIVEYQKCRIRGSLNVNLPSLLIKRYQRGTVSNFNLENFITTPEGRDMYLSKKQQASSPKFSTILEQKAMEAEQKKKSKPIWVVYDYEMSEDDQTSQAWTLLNVLERLIGADKKNPGKVYYLCGGFQSFLQYQEWLESSQWQQSSLPPNIFSTNSAGTTNTITTTTTKQNNIPRRSISYTIGESKTDLHKRTSLFSLDTQAARVNNANALARRAKRRSHQQAQDTASFQHHAVIHANTTSTATGTHLNNNMAVPSSNNPLLNRVAEDDEVMTADCSPRTESDFGFVISEIIPGFLFVGPEIETSEQADQLIQERQIKRVLNMAEECQDEGLSQRSVRYHKIAARDTLEMKNIELVMMEAVHFIEEAKKNHEPIYVHCKAGKSRSITAILAYLVTSERWTLKRAYRHVIKARPNMSPNIGFISELMKMEAQVHGRVSSFLESDWQSTSLPSPDYANELFQLEKAWQTAAQV
ncbi:hypothetical protein MAM1_0387c10227 [Mucor ambiguus]|uniref:protein-tyrosine-phosphatase n=1 Tax=Mucor ambiguus TaxID=91626 RepID=A0A0C9N3P4_9FUNG|nr:hypothetical protein MAM1_0387c10227 [Mucor ambiguus]